MLRYICYNIDVNEVKTQICPWVWWRYHYICHTTDLKPEEENVEGKDRLFVNMHAAFKQIRNANLVARSTLMNKRSVTRSIVFYTIFKAFWGLDNDILKTWQVSDYVSVF